MVELILVGISVGFVSGFFGIGGGTLLIPVLLLIGFATKEAIGVSVVQMFFSSVFGSYVNNKKRTLDVAMITTIGIGGFSGALLSGYITAYFNDKVLETIFLCFAVIAFIRMFVKTKEHKDQRQVNKFVLFMVGFFVGTISITIGIGGSIILIPILVGFLHVPLKKAISSGLFFVVFSSTSGLISHSINGHIDYKNGVIIGLSSLIGVYFGIIFKDKIDIKLQKRLLASYYFCLVVYLFQRIYF